MSPIIPVNLGNITRPIHCIKSYFYFNANSQVLGTFMLQSDVFIQDLILKSPDKIMTRLYGIALLHTNNNMAYLF